MDSISPGRPRTPSLVTRNLRLPDRRTSVRLEALEWAALEAICARERIDRHDFAERVATDPARPEKTLTSRLRSAILAYFAAAAGVPLSVSDGQPPRITANSSGNVAKDSSVETTTRPATWVGSRR